MKLGTARFRDGSKLRICGEGASARIPRRPLTDPVEGGSRVAQGLSADPPRAPVAGAERSKVLDGPGQGLAEEAQHDATPHWLRVRDDHVQVHLVHHLGKFAD